MKMGKWMKKYVPLAGSIPSSDVLRRHHLPQVLEKYLNSLAHLIKNQKLTIGIDGTTDRCSRKLLNGTVLPTTLTGKYK